MESRILTLYYVGIVYSYSELNVYRIFFNSSFLLFSELMVHNSLKKITFIYYIMKIIKYSCYIIHG